MSSTCVTILPLRAPGGTAWVGNGQDARGPAPGPTTGPEAGPPFQGWSATYPSGLPRGFLGEAGPILEQNTEEILIQMKISGRDDRLRPRSGALWEVRGIPRGGRARAQVAFRRWISAVRAGSTVNRSPTMPKSARAKIGASASLLMATIVLAVCMPARCWIAPEIPTAT